MEHVVDSIGAWAYVLVFLLTAGETAAFIGLLLPGETLVILAGALAGRGRLDAVAVTVAVVTGGALGDSLGFAIGRWCRSRPGAQRILGRLQPGGKGERARELLGRRGGAAVFLGRFIGVVRSFVPLAAGVTELPYRRFLPYSAAASVIWGTGSVLLGYFFGPQAEKVVRAAGTTGGVALGGAAALAAVFLLARRSLRRRGRGAREAAAETPRLDVTAVPAAPGPGPVGAGRGPGPRAREAGRSGGPSDTGVPAAAGRLGALAERCGGVRRTGRSGRTARRRTGGRPGKARRTRSPLSPRRPARPGSCGPAGSRGRLRRREGAPDPGPGDPGGW